VGLTPWHGSDQEEGNFYGPGQPIPRWMMVAGDVAEQLEKLTALNVRTPRRNARDRRLVNRGRRIPLSERHLDENHRMPPPSQLEVVAFWIVGIVITILSGGLAIYASHHHLWG
jgi:hypothetical protein